MALFKIIVLTIAILTGLLCVYGIVRPGDLIDRVNRVWRHRSGLYIAVIVRLIFGAALIALAAQTKFPLAIKIIGYIAIIAAILIPVMGRERIGDLLNWFERADALLARLWLSAGLAFAGFLLYAVA